MTLTSVPINFSMTPMAKDPFFLRRRAGLDIKARDLVLKRAGDGVDVKISIIYAHGDHYTVFNTHPHLPLWPPTTELLRKICVSQTDMESYSLSSAQWHMMAHWRQAAGLPFTHPNSNPVAPRRNLALPNGNNGNVSNGASDGNNLLDGGQDPSYLPDSAFGTSLQAESSNALLNTENVPTRDGMGGFFAQDNFNFGSGLFEDGQGGPTTTKVKPEYNSEGEGNHDEEDGDDDEFENDNADEDEDSDGDDYEVVDQEEHTPFVPPSTSQSYPVNNRRNSPKRRRTGNNGYISVANSEPSQYMPTSNQAPQNSGFVPVNGRKRMMKGTPSLRQVQSTNNLIQRPQVPQARMMRNTPVRTRSFEGQGQAPARRTRMSRMAQ